MCVIVAWLAAAAWLGLLLFRGGYWRIEARPISEPPADWPSVVALIPARDEAAVVGDTVRSHLSQDYPGKFFVILVDDSSQDNTADAAREAAAAIGQAERLRVVAAQPLPEGWTGKMWAQSQAVADAELNHPDAELWLLSDADITHAPDELRRMVALLTSHKLDMASLMVRLSTSSFAEACFGLGAPFLRVERA